LEFSATGNDCFIATSFDGNAEEAVSFSCITVNHTALLQYGDYTHTPSDCTL